MLCLLISLLPIVIVVVGLILSSRYGRKWTTLTIVIALCCGCIVSLIVRANFKSDIEKYTEEDVFPAEEWRKRDFLNVNATGFVYRPNNGLFVTTSQKQIQVAGILPTCLIDGPLSRYRGFSPPVRSTLAPMISLPPPPSEPSYQITFDILI